MTAFPFPDHLSVAQADKIKHWRTFYTDTQILDSNCAVKFNITRPQLLMYLRRNPRKSEAA